MSGFDEVFDLSKATEAAREQIFDLRKRDPRFNILDLYPPDVDGVYDCSSSMSHLFADKLIQHVGGRGLAVSNALSSGRPMKVFSFNHAAHLVGEVRPSDYESDLRLVSRQLVASGTTDYAAFIREVLVAHGFISRHDRPRFQIEDVRPSTAAQPRRGFFKRLGDWVDGIERDEPAEPEIRRTLLNPPEIRAWPRSVLANVYTDGEPFNGRSKEEAVEDARQWMIFASYFPVFFQFIAIGNDREDFPTLLEFDEDLPERLLDNANFGVVPNPRNVPDSVYNEMLLSEFVDYPPKALNAGILLPRS
jgi:hypothetical protein